MHWVIHSILYLPKEEGGQGLVHLQSRTATFHLQFTQFLTGPESVSWRPVASAVLKTGAGLNLDKSLFLLDPKTLNVEKFPVFLSESF